MNPTDALESLLPAEARRALPLDTPARFVKFMAEALSGYSEDPFELARVFTTVGLGKCLGPVTVTDLAFSSVCEHHLAPFFGTAEISYQPADGRVLGLSKFARILDAVANRLQLQEILGADLARILAGSALDPDWVLVKLKATHTCMTCRGVKRYGATTETISTAGRRTVPEVWLRR
jgi:GTP cyclohydrolase IA